MRTLLDTRQEETYANDILLAGGLVITPNWKPGAVTAYRLRR